MATALLSLGSNVGDRAAALKQSLELLARSPGVRVIATSSFHETKPAGGPPAQERFLNAAAVLETSLAPLELLSVLQQVEHQLGRVRGERWGPRTIDLDLLLYDQVELETPELTLPHPRMSFRRFVLEPAAEIAAEMVHPVCGNTIGGLLRHMDRWPRSIVASGSSCFDLSEVFADADCVRIVVADLFPCYRASGEKLEQIHKEWGARNEQQLEDAIRGLAPGEWVVTDWWELAERWSNSGERSRLAYDALQLPRLLVVADNRINDLRLLIREHYRGPVLWLEGCTAGQLRDEVLAAIAAME